MQQEPNDNIEAKIDESQGYFARIISEFKENLPSVVLSYFVGLGMGAAGRFMELPASDPDAEVFNTMSELIPASLPLGDAFSGRSVISLRFRPPFCPYEKLPGRTACFLSYAAGVATVNADRIYYVVANIADKL